MQEMKIIPYEAVGEIKFGMTEVEVEKLFDTQPIVRKSWSGNKNLVWDNLRVGFSKEGVVQECSFFPDGKYQAVFNEYDLFANDLAFNELCKNERPLEVSGCLVFMDSGISVTGLKQIEQQPYFQRI